jgi:hypothetical protein
VPFKPHTITQTSSYFRSFTTSVDLRWTHLDHSHLLATVCVASLGFHPRFRYAPYFGSVLREVTPTDKAGCVINTQ